MNKAIKYTLENDSELIAREIINQFPDTKESELAMMIERYKEYDCWLENTEVNEDIFNNLEEFLIEFDLIEEKVPFNDLVKNYYHD